MLSQFLVSNDQPFNQPFDNDPVWAWLQQLLTVGLIGGMLDVIHFPGPDDGSFVGWIDIKKY